MGVRKVQFEKDGRYLKIVANHHLEHEKQLSVRDETIAIHVVHVEGNWRVQNQASGQGR